MNEPAETLVSPEPEAPKKTNIWLIVGIVVIVLCCCCVVGAIALYFGYDKLGDPLGIYGALPRLLSPIM